MAFSEEDYWAILRMLVKRATLLDRWRAWHLPYHWLNCARRDLLVAGETKAKYPPVGD